MRGPAQIISSVMGCANPGHVSPVAGGDVSNNVGAFHMRTDFDMLNDNRDMNLGPETPEPMDVRNISRKSERKHKYEAHPPQHQSEKQQNHDSGRRRHEEESKKKLSSRPTVSIPSDESESYGTSTRPSGTMSLSLEETMTDPTNDHIADSHTQSNSMAGDLSTAGKESHDNLDNKYFFNGGRNGRTSSFGSTSRVSFSDSSNAESQREKKLDREQQRRQRPPEKLRVDSHEHRPLRDPQIKVDERRGDKFRGTKSKRREMRDRRQDENVERSTPSSKNSEPPRRAFHEAVSPSGDSMAYSLDSSSQFRPPFASNNNDGGSVFTMGTMATENQSLLSYVTRSTMVHSRFQEDDETKKNQAVPTNKNVEEEGGDDISLSLLESNSSIVPTDEDLNAIGWAKALDPNSGSYYYFTLDRQKTVWENPLAMSP